MERSAVEVADADFQHMREFLARKTGLHFQESKRDELLSILQDRLAVLTQYRDLGEYLANLEHEQDGGSELRGLVSRLTVGETYFFRNRPQFAALRSNILPALIERQRRRSRRLRLWSAGCATGEEAYSLAILLVELIPDLALWKVHILATDINEDSLGAAREGVYRSWSFREVEEHYRRRYFLSEGQAFRVRPEVRGLVTFRYLNLADDLYPSAVTGTDEIDLILCRNVMIYFRPEMCLDITRRFFQSIGEEGFLLIGHSEHSGLVYPAFSRKFFGRTIVYQKVGSTPAWEKGVALRFRGSGPLAPGAITHQPPGARGGGIQRPPHTPETLLFERAVELVSEMRPAEAVAEFKRVLELNPRNERSLYSIAIILADAGDNAGAREWADRLLQVNPLHLEATYLVAIIAREMGKSEEELRALKKTLYLNPDFVLGHFQSGVHHLRAGNPRFARRSFLNVLDLLKERAADDLVAGVGGMTVGRLREAVLGMIPGGAPAERP